MFVQIWKLFWAVVKNNSGSVAAAVMRPCVPIRAWLAGVVPMFLPLLTLPARMPPLWRVRTSVGFVKVRVTEVLAVVLPMGSELAVAQPLGRVTLPVFG